MSNRDFKMEWSRPPVEPLPTTSGTVDFSSLIFISDPQDNDELLIYDVSESANRKITKVDLTNISALISSINTLGLLGGEMIYAASPIAFASSDTKAFGRSLVNTTSVNEFKTLTGLTIGTDVQAWASILDALTTSAASAVNNDIFYYNSGALSRVTLSNYVRDTLLTTASASALTTALGAVTYSSATDNRMLKWDGSGGLVQTTGITISDSNDITGVNSLNTVTSTELTQIANINSVTINNTQWGYLGASDQGISTTNDPTFNSITATTTIAAAGGSMTGNINMNSNKLTSVAAPTAGGDAANKTYVDSVAGSGVTPLEQSRVASTANVAYTYNNTGGSNSRGSLTAPVNGAVVIDGVSLSLADRVLVKDQTTALQNGIYVVDVVGDGSNPYVLERAADFYSAVAPLSNAFSLITEGTVNAGDGYILSATVTTFGTDPVNWVLYSTTLTAGSGLTQSGGALNVNTVSTSGNIYVNGSNQVDINGALAVSKGGTNATSFTADRLIQYNAGGTAMESSSLASSAVVTLTGTQSLTNKTVDSNTNTVTADALWNKTGNKISLNNAPSAVGEVLKISSLSPLQVEWINDDININGLTAETSADNNDEIAIYDSTAGANRKMTRANFLTGITATQPSGVIIVAKANGDYTTIAAGLAAASSGDVVLVYPGTYAESVTIPAGVRLVGFPAAQQVILSGADTTSTRVTAADTSTLREFTVVAPSSGGNPAIDCTGLGIGEIFVIFNCVVQGAGGTGHGISGAGSGVLAILAAYHNGGTLGGSFINVSSGTTTAIELIGSVGSCVDFINCNGTSRFFGQVVTFQTSALYSCTDMMDISSTGEFELDGLVSPDPANSPITNMLHISGDGVDVSISGAHFHTVSGGFDILVDSGLTGAGTAITITAEYTQEKTSIPTGYKNGCDVFITAGIGKGDQNDPSFLIDGELSVGSPGNPSEAIFGEGDSTVTNMFVFSFNGVATYVDNTVAAKSRAASTFNLFQGVTTGNIAYFGNLNRQFVGLRTAVVTQITLGSGVLVWEYWNGSAWTSFNVMSSLANYPYTQRATDVFSTANGEQIRYDTAILTDWALSTVNSQSAYWTRVRITTAITTSPVLERIKLGTNRTEINGDGFIEYFGVAQPSRTIIAPFKNESLGTPTISTFNLSTNIPALDIASSQLSGNSNEGFAIVIIIDPGTDTSRPLTAKVEWCVENAATGDVVLTCTSVGSITPGDNVTGGSLTEVVQNDTTTVAVASAGILQTTTFSIDINSAQPDDRLVIQISRDATGGSPDTVNGDVLVFSLSTSTIRWTA